MGIEEMFKDLKGRFFLEACQCRSTDRITRLCLFPILAFWFLALLVRFPQSWPRFITARGKLSFLSLALEWLEAPAHLRNASFRHTQTG